MQRRVMKMDKQVMLYAGIALAGVFISAVSQVILKKAAGKKRESVLREYLNLPVILAYGMFFGATLLSVFALRVIPVSMGGILDSAGYIFITLFGVLIFKEKITPKKAAALLLILAGIIVYSL
jgi:multidrug transporter EmrE-like cation transporter